jgi:integrase
MCKYGVSDKVAAERLGHSQVSTLRNVYQHVLKDMDQTAADEIDAMFTKKKKLEEKKANFKVVN